MQIAAAEGPRFIPRVHHWRPRLGKGQLCQRSESLKSVPAPEKNVSYDRRGGKLVDLVRAAEEWRADQHEPCRADHHSLTF